MAALIVCAVDQNTIRNSFDEAKNANIPVIAFDRDLPDSEATDTYVGPESITDGKACGEAMAEALANEEGTVKVLELVGALNDQNGIDRSTGWNEGMKKLKNLESYSNAYGLGFRDSSGSDAERLSGQSGHQGRILRNGFFYSGRRNGSQGSWKRCSCR